MKFSEIVNHPSFQNIASALRVPFRSTAWRDEHPHMAFWTLWNALVDLPGAIQHPDWLCRWTALQVALAEADADLVLAEADVTWLLAWLEHEPASEATAVVTLLYVYASAPDENLTPAEIASATGTAESTWRNRAAAGEFPGAVKRGKQWLIPERILLDAVTAGKVQPVAAATNGQTWHIQNGDEPLLDVGRVPGKPGMHVLRRTDGSLTVCGGYWLRRPGEVWDDGMS